MKATRPEAPREAFAPMDAPMHVDEGIGVSERLEFAGLLPPCVLDRKHRESEVLVPHSVRERLDIVMPVALAEGLPTLTTETALACHRGAAGAGAVPA